MFNLSTLSGINLQTDNYFQYTSTPWRSDKNVLAFKVKRPCVLLQMHLRLKLNALAFFYERKTLFTEEFGCKKLPHPNG